MKVSKITKLIVCAAVLILASSVFKSTVASTKSKDQEEIAYADANLGNFAKTYWRFSKFEYDDDQAVDNFMKITECNLYTEYYHNEFEWNGIREATRTFLEENRKKFPDRYEFIQPIALGDYDFSEEKFMIAEEHVLNGIKSFEIASMSQSEEVCGSNRPVDGYPRLMALELSRPIIFNEIPIEQEIAREIISEKMSSYENLQSSQKTRERYLRAREVYFVAKVKMFAYKPGLHTNDQGQDVAKMLGILERVEVYEDIARSNLIYQKDFRRKKKKKKKDF